MQAAYVTCQLAGADRVTWASALLPVALVALRPLLEQWPTGELVAADAHRSGSSSSGVAEFPLCTPAELAMGDRTHAAAISRRTQKTTSKQTTDGAKLKIN